MLPLIVIFIPMVMIWLVMAVFRMQAKVYDLNGKVVLITGASSGLGEACAWKFARAGAKVILCARNVNRLEDIKRNISIKTSSYEPMTVRLDLNELDNIPHFIEKVLALYGCVDVVINNAGVSYRGIINDTSINVHKDLMRINYFGAVAITKELLPSMIEREEGHIVIVSSVQGKIAVPFRSAYAASKHACEAFFNCLRAEVAEQNITVTTISPGYICTNLSMNAVTESGALYGVTDATTATGMDPYYVADQIVCAVKTRKEHLVLADIKSKIAILLNCLAPGIFFKIMKKRAKKEYISKLKNK